MRTLLVIGHATLFLVSLAEAAPRPRQLALANSPELTSVFDQVSPDGEWVVFREEATFDGSLELFAVKRAAGYAPIRLSPPPFAGSTVRRAVVGAAGQVVFLYRPAAATPTELWSVPIGGPDTAAVRLSPTFAAGTDSILFEITPDGQQVVFAGPTGASGAEEMWSVPISGPAAAAGRIGPVAPVGAAGVTNFGLTADGSRVVFRGDFDLSGVFELWSTPTVGPPAAAIKLHPHLSGQRDASSVFEIDPSGSRVVLMGDFDLDGVNRLRSVPITGLGGGVVIDPDPAGGTGALGIFSITPDGSRVVFQGRYNGSAAEAWSVPIEGPRTAAVRLHGAPVAGGEVTFGQRIEISANSSHAILVGDLLEDGTTDVFVASLDGLTTTPLSPYFAGGFADPDYRERPRFANDGARVVFKGRYAAGTDRLYVADTNGPARAATPISGTIATGGEIGTFDIDDSLDRVVFSGDLSFDERIWLYSATLDNPSTRTTLTTWAIFPNADVGEWRLSPLGGWVAFFADLTEDNFPELRRVASGGASGSRISHDAPGLLLEGSLQWTSDGRGVAYREFTDSQAYVLWLTDEWIFAADFEEGNSSEWSTAIP